MKGKMDFIIVIGLPILLAIVQGIVLMLCNSGSLTVNNSQQLLSNMIVVISIFVGFFSTSLTVLIPISEMEVFKRIKAAGLHHRLVGFFMSTIGIGFISMLIYLMLSNVYSGSVCFDLLNSILFTGPFILFFSLCSATFIVVARIFFEVVLKEEAQLEQQTTDTVENHSDMFGIK